MIGQANVLAGPSNADAAGWIQLRATGRWLHKVKDRGQGMGT
jgi:hypothetical protein